LNVLGFGGGEGGDAVRGEVALIVEAAGIAEVAREFEFDGKAKALSVEEEAHGCGWFVDWRGR